MRAPGRISTTMLLLGLGGAALFTVLLLREGVAAVGGAVLAVGWSMAALFAYHLIPLFLDAASWYTLIPPEQRLRFWNLYWMKWVDDGVADLLPAARVGGDVVRARLATFYGLPVPVAAGSVLVDITIGVFTQILFTLFGILLLISATGRSDLTQSAFTGSALALAAIAGFYGVQRAGMFRFLGLIVARLAKSPEWASLMTGGEALDRAARALYARRRGVALCTLWTMLSWLLGSGEVWIALHAMHVPVSLATALIFESVGQGIRGAMFIVPGALGVLEGGYIAIGAMLGIHGEVAMAFSVIRRVRELAFGLPGLIVWQWIEGRRLWSRRMLGTAGAGNPSAAGSLAGD